MAEDNIDSREADSQENTAGQPVPVRINHRKNEEPIRVTDRRFWVQPQDGTAVEETHFSLKPTYVEELERKLVDSQKKQEEMVASYRAFKAEMAGETQKARERIQNEYNKRLVQAKGDLAKRFIDIAENLERALVVSQETQNFESLLEGVKLIRNQFNAALADLGLEEVSVKGKPFNPEIAEAVETVEVRDEAEDNLVMEVVSKGYRINDTLVRPAQVKVGISKSPVSKSAS
jgi:molecular chaperone GrpE